MSKKYLSGLSVVFIASLSTGCRPDTIQSSLSRYLSQEFAHEASGRYLVLDLNGCGSCNQALIESLLTGSVNRDSVKVIITGNRKQVAYYADQFKWYQVFGDSANVLKTYLAEVDDVKFPLQIAF